MEASNPDTRRTPLDWRLAGLLLGGLTTVAVALQGPLGVSTAYVTTQAAIAQQLDPSLVQGNDYLRITGASLTPEWVVVLATIAGAALAAFFTRTRTREAVPSRWRERFGARPALRFAAAFAGGVLLLFGARLAGGCTSGHVISGMSQMALSGMVFAAGAFASGIPLALVMYRRRKA
jgi:hypothetical protein